MKRTLFYLLCLPFGLVAQTDRIQVTDLTKIKSVSSISTNGSKIIYTLSSTEKSEENPLEYDYRSQLYLVSSDRKSSIALTRGKEGVGQAVLSPDGKKVAFVRRAKDKSQIFILPLEGGEPWQLTNSKYGASSPSFSPDGSKILYSVSMSLNEITNDSIINPSKSLPAFSLEKPGFSDGSYIFKDKKTKANPDGSLEEIRAYLNKSEDDKKTRVFTRLNFQGEANLNNTISFSHLYEIEVKEGATPRALVSGLTSFSGGTYSADGKWIYTSTSNEPEIHPDRARENKLMKINLQDLNQTEILIQKGKSLRGMTVSSSGRKAALVVSDIDGLSYARLNILDMQTGKLQEINFDRIPGNMTWTKDEKNLYFTAQSNGGTPVFKLDVTSGKVERLTSYETGISSLELLDSGEWIYAKHEVVNPQEIYVSDLNFKKNTAITQLNDWVKSKALSFPERKTYKNSAGQEVEFWIMKPVGIETGKKYPLLLQLHGGPTAMWGPGEASMWHEFQYFAAQGYGVVYPNQRGSGGYGKDFLASNYRDWGPGPQEDALGAASIAAREAWVDTSKQVITGGSYAGYLTAWIIAHDHRFKAAFAQRGVYDLVTFMGEGNAWRLAPNYFGLPWENEAETKMRANSPYTFVDKIQTPLLIKHGDNDLRTGVIQSEMMFRSLKYLGKETEYVRYAGATHELSRTGNIRQRIDRILRIHEFFQRYIK